MSIPTNGDENAEDRAISRALHAETGRGPVDEDALADYEAVLSYLPLDETAPPPALEDRVLAAARAARPPAVPAVDIRRRRQSTRWVVLGAVAAAAAVVVAFLFVGGGDNDETNTQVEGNVQTIASGDEVAAITATPGVREGTLRSLETVGHVALAPDGSGVIYDLVLSAPEAGRTYWVWLDTQSASVPLGALPSPAPDQIGFTVEGDVAAVTAVRITLESAAATPTSPGALIAVASL